jgi:hypothetical protein
MDVRLRDQLLAHAVSKAVRAMTDDTGRMIADVPLTDPAVVDIAEAYAHMPGPQETHPEW